MMIEQEIGLDYLNFEAGTSRSRIHSCMAVLLWAMLAYDAFPSDLHCIALHYIAEAK